MDRFLFLDKSPEHEALSARYGAAIHLFSSVSRRRHNTLADVHKRLWPAIKLKQSLFLYDHSGVAIAYASWAFLSDDVSNFIIADNNYELDIGDWNEGEQLWIIDFFSPYGDAHLLKRKLIHKFRREHFRIHAIRTYDNGRSSRYVDLRVF